ncbi:hypothetical protein N9J60_00615 [Alphaproteobacteria bacterium]|nr:hypothetical protein [Alphaproteobacteria bacterium]
MTIKFLEALAGSAVNYAIIRDKLDLTQSCELDILCDDPHELVSQLRHYMSAHMPSYNIKTTYGSCHKRNTSSHLHVDAYQAGALKFRYDIVDESALREHNCLTMGALSVWALGLEKRSYHNLDLYFLAADHMNIILVSEFLCFFVLYPSKYKHWDYLIKKYGDEELLLEIMHTKIDTSKLSDKQASQWRKKAIFGFIPTQFYFVKDIKRKLIQLGLKEFTRKAIRRICR